ncbi:hypothetical protein FPANT_4311 [Fusarium pseudoanthophilum]|uniref:Uncharacterized protein n=1 Tax=Fusarium pseudoanthophilum TaxID=48495 RepID=A0A8H5PHL1_9HYPO|nr:hypothetical protein FPANT_4311 [Fusarium pseudoanthophilum]
MVCFSKVFCPCFSRRRRAGSDHGGSSVSDRPSSERRLGKGQPEAQEGGEPQAEVELPNRDAAEQPEAPRIDPQPDDVITSFPQLDGSPDGDNSSDNVSRQGSPQRDTGIAPRTNGTQTDIGGPSNNVSQQGAPQHGTPKPRSRRESHSTAAASAPQANDTQTNAGSPLNDVESPSNSSDDTSSSSPDDSESPRSSPDGDSQANGCKPPPDDKGGNTGSSDGAPQVINTQTNISNPLDNISQQGAPQHSTPKPRIKRGSRRTAAGSLTPGRDLLGGFLNSVSGSSDSDPQANDCNPLDNMSQQGAPKHGAPKHGTPKPRSRRGSRSIAAGSVATYRDLLGGFLNSVSGSSDGDPQANDCNPLNGVESASGSSDAARQANKTQTNRAQKSSGSQRGQDPIISEREREMLGFMALLR